MKCQKDDTPDATLLQRFGKTGDEQAFVTLVERHFNLVHSIACRETGNSESAKDVAQQVFIVLAHTPNPPADSGHFSLWLLHVTRNMARNLKKAEARRARREAISIQLNALDGNSSRWGQIAPEIDATISQLPPLDRKVVLMRFYMGYTYMEIARQLELTTESARKRCDRSLEKLRNLLGKRGIATTASALASMLPANAVTAAPAALSTKVAASALAAPPIKIGVLSPLHFVLMKTTTKIAIAGLCAVGVLTIYTIAGGKFTASSGKAAPSLSLSSDQSGEGGSGTGSLKKGNSSKRSSRTVDPSSDLSELKSILAEKDIGVAARRFGPYIDTLNSADLERVMNYLASLTTDGIDWSDTALIRWISIDPEAATSWALKHSPARVNDSIERWAFKDPDAAWAWVRSRGEGTIGGNSYYAPIISALGQTPDGLGKATEILSSMTPADIKSSDVPKQIRSWLHPEMNPKDLEKIASWTKGLSPDLKKETYPQLINNISLLDPAIALDMCRDVYTSTNMFPGIARSAMEMARSEGKEALVSQFMAGLPADDPSRPAFEKMYADFQNAE